MNWKKINAGDAVPRAGMNMCYMKRELFAMAAMQGLSSCPIPGSHNQPKEIAATAIMIADELLKQLES